MTSKLDASVLTAHYLQVQALEPVERLDLALYALVGSPESKFLRNVLDLRSGRQIAGLGDAKAFQVLRAMAMWDQ